MKEVVKFDGVLLASGGMDSTVLAYHLLNSDKLILPVFVNYGQHCASTEYDRFCKLLPKAFLQYHEVIDISDVYRGSKSRLINEINLWEDKMTSNDLYLLHRNLILLSIAVAFCETRNIQAVYAAFIDSNNVKEIDCSTDFFNLYFKMLGNVGTNVKIKLPFRKMSKLEVARLGLKYKVAITKTYSCQVNSMEPCGACPNCVDRLNAFERIFHDDNRQ